MKAKWTMLTHFSTRYSIVSRLENKHQNVAQALDFMKVCGFCCRFKFNETIQINLQTCRYLRVLDPYLEFIFPELWAELVVEKQKELREIAKNNKPDQRASDI